MAELYIIKKKTLTEIANAIRYKTNNKTYIKPTEMPKKIMSISGGGNGGIDSFLPITHQIEIDTSIFKTTNITTIPKIKQCETFTYMLNLVPLED